MLLDNVAIRPARQRSGLGRYLISFAEEQSRVCGYREIVLYTNQAMHENLELYSRLGYEEFWRGAEHGFDRVYLRKKL
jgi:ribosomal protein S18 acetylase RimI-like enzyme